MCCNAEERASIKIENEGKWNTRNDISIKLVFSIGISLLIWQLKGEVLEQYKLNSPTKTRKYSECIEWKKILTLQVDPYNKIFYNYTFANIAALTHEVKTFQNI